MVKNSSKSALAAMLLSTAILTSGSVTLMAAPIQSANPNLETKIQNLDAKTQETLRRLSVLLDEQKNLRSIYDSQVEAAALSTISGQKIDVMDDYEKTPIRIQMTMQSNKDEIIKILMSLPDDFDASEYVASPSNINPPNRLEAIQQDAFLTDLVIRQKNTWDTRETLKKLDAEIKELKNAGLDVTELEDKANLARHRHNDYVSDFMMIIFDIGQGTISLVEGMQKLDDHRSPTVAIKHANEALQMAKDIRDGKVVAAAAPLIPQIPQENIVPIQNNDSTDTVDRTVFTQPSVPKVSVQHDINAYTVTIDGRNMAMFVNNDTGNVVGYGYTGIGGKTVAPLTASEMDYSQGIFVGKLNEDRTQIVGEFLGITGASSFDNDFQTINIPDHDAISLRIADLPVAAITAGGSGSLLANILIGTGATSLDRTLSFTTVAGVADPYKIGIGSNAGKTSTPATTYLGYGRILSQNRVAKTVLPTIVMDDIGDLKVTVDTTKGSENVTFNFNGTNPQSTGIKAVVNDRIAAGLGQLGNNVMRTGVMFPLDNYESTNLVHFTDFVQGMNNATPNNIGYGFGIVGTPTPVADLPSGTATYNGKAAGYITHQDWGPGTINHMEQFYGNTALNVNFGTSALTGTIETFRHLDDSAIDSFNLTGSVTGNGIGFTMTNSGTGTGTGAGTFFGPTGSEVGGQFTTIDGTVSHDGVFWGAR